MGPVAKSADQVWCNRFSILLIKKIEISLLHL